MKTPLFTTLLALCSVFTLKVRAGHNPRRSHNRKVGSVKSTERSGDQPTGTPSFGNAPYSELDWTPDTFDWGNIGNRSFLVPSWNQHIPTYCGSCYVHGTLMSINDRIKIFKQGSGTDVLLSRQSFLNCGESHGFGSGCGGGDTVDIYGFMHDIGLPDETCNNYVGVTTDTCDDNAMCMNCMVLDDGTKECWPIENYVKYRVKNYGTVTGEKNIMNEVYARGPVVCGLVTDDAFDYRYGGGIWRKAADDQTMEGINHDVEIVGWGVSSEGVKYWVARNSWGAYWGEKGFFKIERGIDLNRIESQCSFALVDPIYDEQIVENGTLTGSMHGLVPKNDTERKQTNHHKLMLDSMNWSAVSLPPMISSLPIGTATTKGKDKDLVQPSDGKKENRTFHRDVLVFILGFSAGVIAFFVLRSRLSQRRLRAWYHQLPEVEIEGGATA